MFCSVKVPLPTGQNRIALVSHHMETRLFKRYSVANELVMEAPEKEVFPGARCLLSLRALVDNIREKYSQISNSTSWTVSPDLYSLFALTSQVQVELFADVINESGVLQHFCSSMSTDALFGSLGSWQQVEEWVSGAAANPPFEPCLIRELMMRFDAGCTTSRPYCRCVILPTGAKYGVTAHLCDPASMGSALVSIPNATLPFKSQRSLLSSGTCHPNQAATKASLLLFG